jgi:hypothetical protein
MITKIFAGKTNYDAPSASVYAWHHAGGQISRGTRVNSLKKMGLPPRVERATPWTLM